MSDELCFRLLSLPFPHPCSHYLDTWGPRHCRGASGCVEGEGKGSIFEVEFFLNISYQTVSGSKDQIQVDALKKRVTELEKAERDFGTFVGFEDRIVELTHLQKP